MPKVPMLSANLVANARQDTKKISAKLSAARNRQQKIGALNSEKKKT